MRPKAFDPTDIIGSKFGQLTVLDFLRKEVRPLYGDFLYIYLCSCECGRSTEIKRPCLVTPLPTQSCGCKKRRAGNKSPCWGGYGEISGSLWAHIKSHAGGREFTISIEEAWALFEEQGGKCALTGLPISLKFSARSASLDRINNKKGYMAGNVQWLHKDVNWMKGRFPEKRFVELCKAVANYSAAP